MRKLLENYCNTSEKVEEKGVEMLIDCQLFENKISFRTIKTKSVNYQGFQSVKTD